MKNILLPLLIKVWRRKIGKQNRRSLLVIGAVVAVIAAEGLVLAAPAVRDLDLKGQKLSLSAYADQILDQCSESQYRPSCYDEEIPKLMDVISMEDAFQVTGIVQRLDPAYQYCHVLGHELSAREVKKNPNDWKDVVSRCPSGICSNGCIHGGFQERFRAESFDDNQIVALKPDLATICEDRATWHPTGLEQASCYHALGHLTMYVSSGEVDKALPLCEELSLKSDGRDYRQLCFDGVFMQIFQPLEPEDFALVRGKQPTKETFDSYCTKYSGSQKGSCISEGWPLFSEEITTPQGLVDFCGREEASQTDRCYSGLEYVLTARFGFDQERIVNFCKGLPKERQGQCFANAAGRMIETDYRNIDKSVAICLVAESANVGDRCYQELVLFSTYNFKAESEEFFHLCRSLPNPWNERCLDKRG